MKVGISACSNGHLPEWQDQIKTLKNAKAIMIGKEHIFRDRWLGATQNQRSAHSLFYRISLNP